MKYLSLIFMMISFNSFAGYQCEVALSDSNKLNEVVAKKTVVASDKDLRSEMIEDFYTEVGKESFVLKIFIDGWSGEEEMSAVVYGKRNSGEKLEALSEKVSLRGDDKETLWFDSYKLKVTCSLA